jgi:hypothetical protein
MTIKLSTLVDTEDQVDELACSECLVQDFLVVCLGYPRSITDAGFQRGLENMSFSVIFYIVMTCLCNRFHDEVANRKIFAEETGGCLDGDSGFRIFRGLQWLLPCGKGRE